MMPAPRAVRRAVLILVALIPLAWGFTASRAASQPADSLSAEGPPIPAPVGFVNDAANVIDEPTRAKLEAFLDQLKQKTSVEFAILTMKTTAPVEPSAYKVLVFQKWGLGKKGEDNGLLMLVAMDEHEVRFETGYGLEGTLPDGLQSRIFREIMAPRFRAGDPAGGIVAGVLEVSRRIGAEKGVTLVWDGRELRYTSASRERGFPGWIVALTVFFLLFVVLPSLLYSRRRGGPGGWYMGPGGFGGWGGGGFGGGGFGGGGFGGGGGSFGGFGGGSSGGGGGGGKW